ncbi:hypothetical protein BGZ97_009778, partial [Linnemannia gamsii]
SQELNNIDHSDFEHDPEYIAIQKEITRLDKNIAGILAHAQRFAFAETRGRLFR